MNATGTGPAFKTLLVPTDGSPLSAKALAAAIEFARPLHASIIVIAVAEPYPDCLVPVTEDFDAKAVMAARGRVMKAEQAVRQAGLDCDGITVRSFEPHHEILDAAVRLHCDAIFMGIHGSDPVGRFFFGSQAQKVLAHSPVPVMLLR
jgi:nucleotide-binding universal stress UspA family protein